MSFIKILRPFNCLFVALSVLFGAFYLNSQINLFPIIFAVISATMIAAAGYVINDFFDLPIDMINKPDRILPSKKITPKTAYMYSVTLFFIGILSSYLTHNLYCVGLAILNSVALFYYARFFKLSFLSGNILVAYAAGSTFIFGGLVSNNLENSIIIAIYAFLYTLIREFIKDAEDIEGDASFGARTLAVKIGRKKTALVSIIPTFLIVGFTFHIQNSISILTFRLLQIFVSIPLILFIILLINNETKAFYNKISTFMKLDMLVLLIILWVGK
jgi:geranylgeranylglycerol-phosphate geranylgeranyltransferase